MPRRRRRPPPALRRLHGRRARTLEETILALLPHPPPPPSPSQCFCGGRICVACAGASRLLCDQDPAEYRNLLTRAFCVVDDSAPLPPDEFLRRGSDQRSIVRKVIELLKGNPRVCNNVLCKGYDQPSRLSLIGESLCTPAWDHLLTRIGDALMIFLLKYSSIYVPFPNKNYHQLTGIPLNSLIKKSKVLYSTSNSSSQQSCLGDNIRLANQGNKMKRRLKYGDGAKMDAPLTFPNRSASLNASRSIISNDHDVLNGNSRKRARECQSKEIQTNCVQYLVHDTNNGSIGNKDNSDDKHPHKSERRSSLHPKEHIKPYFGDVTNSVSCLKRETSFGTLRYCNSAYGKEDMNACLLSSDSQELLREEIVVPRLTNSSDAILSSGTVNVSKSAFGCHKDPRRRARLYSWQRRQKRKLGHKDALHDEKFHGASDIKLPPQHLVSERLNNIGVIAEVESLQDLSPLTVPGSIKLEENDVISKTRAHSLHAKQMVPYQGDMSFVDNNYNTPLPMMDIEPQELHIDISYSGKPPMPLKETLQPVVSQNCMTLGNLQTKSTPIKVTSIKQDEHPNHSENMVSLCFHCLLLQAPQKVVAGDPIKRRYIFYDRFLSASVFPRNHILNRLRPNDSGALSLMKHIFGISEAHLGTYSSSWNHCNGYSANKSECLEKITRSSKKSSIFF